MYNERAKESTLKYLRTKTKGVCLRFPIREYTMRIQPAVERSGLPLTTFIRQAINEKIERESAQCH